MNKEQLTWLDVNDAAYSMFNIMGNSREIGFAENTWQKLSELGLTSYSNNFEKIKIKILFFSLGDLYRDFCNLVYDKSFKFKYSDLIRMMDIDVFTLGRFYQEIIKPKENKLPADFSSSKALEELSKYFRKDIYKLLSKIYGTGAVLFINLWRPTDPYPDENTLKDIENLYINFTPAKAKAYSWIENGCYVILERGVDF